MSDNRSPWSSYHFRAMGSQISVWMEAGEKVVDDLLPQAEAIFLAAEATFSRFEPSSELSYLNARAGRWVALSPQMWAVVNEALAMARRSAGLFDPTILEALEAAGYDRSFEHLSEVRGRPEVQPQRGRWQGLRLDEKRRRLRLPPEVRLDLGGIVKGYTAQQVVDHLGRWGPCLVDAGGDLVAGKGPASWPGWPVAVAAPSPTADSYGENSPGENSPGADTPGESALDLFQLWLAEATLATSGVDYRRWQHNGQPAHHLIDPRTGRPAQTDALTVTVLAPDAVHAEGWATAALVAGLRRGAALLQRHNLAGVLVGEEGQMRMTPAMAARALAPTRKHNIEGASP